MNTGVMYAIRLGARALAHTRFAVSPLYEVCGLLELVARPERVPPNRIAMWARTREALRDGGLDLLDGLARPGYLPDLLTPHPLDADGEIDIELATVRATRAKRVRREFDLVRTGRPAAGLPPTEISPVVEEVLSRGTDEFVERAADELATLWRLVLAPRWSGIRSRLVADIAQRADVLAREGAAALLGGLHRDVRWCEDRNELQIDSRYCVTRDCDDTLVLLPSAVRHTPNVLADPVDGPRRPPVVCYPAGTAQLPNGDARASGQLLGATRARLLRDLAIGRTTTELAARHHLTPSSVSYRLGVLHRAGLASRSRAGSRVLYQRTSRADAILG